MAMLLQGEAASKVELRSCLDALCNECSSSETFDFGTCYPKGSSSAHQFKIVGSDKTVTEYLFTNSKCQGQPDTRSVEIETCRKSADVVNPHFEKYVVADAAAQYLI
eukprot:CAMPEP_0206454758 /NCGR_PEP_ID=MMETSP0324_2-20121206/21332_1 /ASSEMBLY_ACC=CAM_ASM_000836 /TAXON_ID=2866 /ORGANISM="Crypthecodinium cohnii, Strain Seligo" /LENGTH=106 /DNA_ID=CAMNT_0053925301 /DNA_START=139 /DNA_END=459 /DNA_ORIENTATION=-